MDENRRNIRSVFDRYGDRPDRDTVNRWTEMGGKIPYKAVELASTGQSSTLRCHYSNGDMELLRYMNISNILYLDRTGALSVAFPTGLVAILGRNLHKLLDAFEQERVKTIIAFDPERHEAPGESEPVIVEMHWVANSEMVNAQP